MKIGIQVLAYNCEATFEKILKPWLKLKNKYDIQIWVGSGQFKEYDELGYKNLNQKTEELLSTLFKKGDVDFVFHPDLDNLLTDAETRNKCIPWMKDHDIDLMIQVDADEFYSNREAKNLIEFVEANPDHTIYNTIFKNVIGDGIIKDWSRFSAGWIKKHGGIKNYYFDMHWSFNDGFDYRSQSVKEIPKNLLNPYHYTWTNGMNTTGPSHIKQKIDYQNKIYSTGCSFEWDDSNNEIKIKK